MSIPSEREESIFEAALQLPPEQRAAYLDQACGADVALRQRVEALLQAHERAGQLPGPTILVQPEQFIGEGPGTVIGRYRLLELIGEGEPSDFLHVVLSGSVDLFSTWNGRDTWATRSSTRPP